MWSACCLRSAVDQQRGVVAAVEEEMVLDRLGGELQADVVFIEGLALLQIGGDEDRRDLVGADHSVVRSAASGLGPDDLANMRDRCFSVVYSVGKYRTGGMHVKDQSQADEYLTDAEFRAWHGCLQFTNRALRALDEALITEHGISVKEFDVLITLFNAAEGTVTDDGTRGSRAAHPERRDAPHHTSRTRGLRDPHQSTKTTGAASSRP